MKVKLRKGMTLGALAAENDALLEPSFLDQGHLETLMDASNPRFLILGRAGSGKTALIKMLQGKVQRVSALDPDGLSMQYLHNSPILKAISSWGVSLDVFYKYLWRHICILELIRMRFGDTDDVPSKLQQIFDFAQLWKKDERKTRELSQEYIQSYGSDYWIKTDTRVKNITTEIESKLKSDPSISAKLGNFFGSVGATIGSGSRERTSTKVEEEVVERAQSIVSDFQIAALNRVVEYLERYGFRDQQQRFFLVIDDLDKDWMPDDAVYLDLLKSLLYTVHELNGKLHSVKIIVALRENIYHRVFQKATKHEPQREKWLDVQVKLTWTKDELVALIDNRLREIFRVEYTLQAPTLGQMLPDKKRRTEEDAVDYILDRTFMRPRDVIDFINTCISQSASLGTLSWSNITRAESEFSRRRLTSIFDEWKDSYFGLPAAFSVLRILGPRFSVSDFTDSHLYDLMQSSRCEDCEWLSRLQKELLGDVISPNECKIQILRALYLVGIIGVRQEGSTSAVYSFDRAFSFFPEALERASIVIHKMFWNALNIGEGPTSQRAS